MPTNEVPGRLPPGVASTGTASTGAASGPVPTGIPTGQTPGRPDSPPGGRPRGPVWLVVTTVGVVVVAALGAATTARVGALALAVLVAGCAVVRAVESEPGPTALSVRSRRTDVLVLSVLAVTLVAVATQLPAS